MTKVGEKWEVAFEYFAGGSTRVHVCTYELKEIALRQQRRCARMPWEERIYDRPRPRPVPRHAHGWRRRRILDRHRQQRAGIPLAGNRLREQDQLEIPKKDAKEETREMDTFFNNVIKMEMRLNRITQKQPTDDR